MDSLLMLFNLDQTGLSLFEVGTNGRQTLFSHHTYCGYDRGPSISLAIWSMMCSHYMYCRHNQPCSASMQSEGWKKSFHSFFLYLSAWNSTHQPRISNTVWRWMDMEDFKCSTMLEERYWMLQIHCTYQNNYFHLWLTSSSNIRDNFVYAPSQ